MRLVVKFVVLVVLVICGGGRLLVFPSASALVVCGGGRLLVFLFS